MISARSQNLLNISKAPEIQSCTCVPVEAADQVMMKAGDQIVK